MDALARELALVSPWSLEQATAAVRACDARGLSLETTRKLCQLSLESSINIGWFLEALK